MNITYYGHAAFLIETNGSKLLFDPFISPNPKADHIDVEAIETDYILLTHGHVDHVADAAAIAKRTGAKVISNFEIVSWYEKQGISGHGMNHGGQWHFDFGRVKMVNAIHSSVLPDGTYGGNPCGFVVESAGKCFYLAGDTALTFDMQLLPMTEPKLDFAILPIGDNFTMGYADAVIASDFIKCDKIIGCHYNSFPPIEIDEAAARKSFSVKNKELILLIPGESIQI